MDKRVFDPEYLKQRYREELEKRTSQGTRAYAGIAGTRYFDDPHVKERLERDAIEQDMDVLIIGGGIAGLQTAGHLVERGVTDIRIVEKAADFGGTWYWSRYPGAACDVESFVYMPFLEETGYVPSEKYAKTAEIFEHLKRVGRHFGLYEKTSFQTKVTSLAWDEDRDRWIVGTDRGDVFRARFVSMAYGSASLPRLPSIPGIDRFKGKAFHTARWDFGYTGGDSTGGLTGLKDKKVVVIGTGATAVQVVPAIAPWCDHLYVVQRTPSSIEVRGNAPTDPEWARTLKPGWQRERIRNFEAVTLGMAEDTDLVQDGWTDASKRLFRWPREKHAAEGGDLGALMQHADFDKMEELRARVDAIVKDKATAEALKPWYNLHCKRPCYHDEYLAAFNRPNVTLIDTQGRSVERITEHGIVIDGREYPVDLIIFSTGFEIQAFPSRAAEFEIVGTGGQTLEQHWANGYRSVHGIFFHGFPNLAMVGAVRHGGGSFNVNIVFDEQTDHTAAIFARCLEEGVTRIEPTLAAEEDWLRLMREKNVTTQEFLVGCTPSYINAEGAGGEDSLRVGVFGGGTFEYFDHLRRFREEEFGRGLRTASA